MSKIARSGNTHREQDEAQGPNLKLLYGLIVLALVAAIAIAALIVLPFYLRR
jgi:hypothetical protein